MNITNKIRIPTGCGINAPVYDHIPNGWYVPNNVNTDKCVPTYTNVGGGITESQLLPFVGAVEKSISILNSRIVEIESLKKVMRGLYE